MSHELICAWLGLPVGVWPPDHYALLGLAPGENNPNVIEERVHQRLDMVRRYQMTNPDTATEAMNRIAQAFVCLSEVASKRVYDAALLGQGVGQPSGLNDTANQALDPLNATVVEDREPLVLDYNATTQEAAPPVRLLYDPANDANAPPIRRTFPTPPPVPEFPEAIPFVTEVLEPPLAIPVIPVAEAVQVPPPRRGLAAHRQVYQRLVQTRRLTELWNQAGKFLAVPKRRLARVGEFNDLQRLLGTIREKLRSFPPLLGEAGQPGYLVLALTQLSAAPQFQALAPGQRETLSRDWQAGQQALAAHRDFLRREARLMRKRNIFQRLGKAIAATFVEHPGRVLIVLGVLALNVAVMRTYVFPWVDSLIRSEAAKINSASDGGPEE